MSLTKGIIYTAGGKQRYIDEAIYSAKSVKKHNKSIGTTLFTSFKHVNSRYFDNIIYQEPIKHPQKYKIENMLNSPYEHTLYLDSDTKIVANIEELFDFLLIYDLGVTNRVKCEWNEHPVFIDYIDERCYNGGFLLFNNSEKVKTFIKAWSEKMNRNKDEDIRTGTVTGDQFPLNELFFDENLPDKLGIKYVILPNKVYNARPWLWKQAKIDGEYNNIKIFHASNLNKSLLATVIENIKYRIRKSF